MVKMMTSNDIIVVGSGIAGLVAAITAAEKGKTVTIVSHGAGVLSIGSGTIDILGYDKNSKIIKDNPINYIEQLDDNHPYKIIGKENIENAIADFIKIVNDNGLNLSINDDKTNRVAVTIAGKIRPTYITSKSVNAYGMLDATNITIATVKHLKDCEPKLTGRRLSQYKSLKDKTFYAATLKSPFGKTKRALNSLDIARYVETEEGLNWLKTELLKVKNETNADVILMPPISGVLDHDRIYAELLSHVGCKIIEMASMPPGVGGFRIRQALMNKIHSLDITFVENCIISGANVVDGKCVSLIGQHSDLAGDKFTEYKADAFVIATGGIIGGGINIGMTETSEAIFNIPLSCPSIIEERTCKNVFDSHPYVLSGVNIDNKMRAIDKGGATLFSNVFFAGKTVGNYDYAKEKSGYGVAISTGTKAGLEASLLEVQ